MAQALPDPYSGLARGLQMGQNMKMQHEQMMLQKADRKMKQDLSDLNRAFNMLNIPGLPEEKKVEIFNKMIVPISNRMNPKEPMSTINEWPKEGDQFGKQVMQLSNSYKEGKISPKDYIESLNMTALKAQAAGKQLDISSFEESAKKDVRRGLVERPSVPGLPAETAPVGQGLTLTRGEIPERTGGLTPMGKGMSEAERYSFVETGEVPKPKTEKNIERTVDLGNKVRIFYTDGTHKDISKGATPGQAGKSDPWTRGAMSIVNQEYGTLTDQGYVTDPERAEEKRNAITYLEDYKKKGIKYQDAAVLAIRRSAAGGVDPIQQVIDQQREAGKTDKEIRELLKKSKFKAVNPRIYGLK